MKFAELGLHESILDGVADAGYDTPTDIQARAIPLALDGRDIVGLGQTGSGKTAAFGLPLLSGLADGEPGLRAVILVPTRELCVQVAENLRGYAKYSGLHVCTAFGGIPMSVQEAAFRRGLDVLVACPGRMIDHIQSGNIELDNVGVLVLDEADRMLDMGFMPQIRRILSRLPGQRQNLLFSATMPPEVDRLIKDFLNEDPARVQVGQRSQAASTVTQRFEEVHANDKVDTLTRLLRGPEGDSRVLIFVNRKTRAEELGRKLKRAGLPADSIHGDKSAESRHVVLQAFSRGKTRHLVATDVAARGIDVTDIGVVVNFDLPLGLEDYIHRVGRTGRAGSDGQALSLVAKMERRQMQDILNHLEKTSKGSRILVNGKVIREGERLSKETKDRRDTKAAKGRSRGRSDDAEGAVEQEPRSRRRSGRSSEADLPQGQVEEPRSDSRRTGQRGGRRTGGRGRQIAAKKEVSIRKVTTKPKDDGADVVW